MKTICYFLLFMLLFIGQATLSAQDKYAALVHEVRNEVWSMDLPGFKNTTVPEKYKDKPAVILAAHNRLEVTRKTRVDWWGTALTNQQITYRKIYRQMVYLNSQEALENMSEYSFLSQEKERYTRNEQQQILGIRILKPDGTIKEIASEEYKEIDEANQSQGRYSKEKWQKLAVPGLQIGDIIDVFIAQYIIMNNRNIDPFGFFFQKEYPTLAYSVHCEIDPKLSTYYRCLNGAPDFNQSVNPEGNYILDLQTNDTGRTIPGFWYNNTRQTPMILMYIYNSKTPYIWMPPTAKSAGLHANPNPQLIVNDAREAMKAPAVGWANLRSGRKGEIAKALKARQTEGWSDEKLMNYLYQYCYYRYMESGANYSPANFVILMHNLLKKAGISHQMGITTKDNQIPLSQLIDYEATTWFIYLNANGKCYTPPFSFPVPGQLPIRLQGEEAILADGTSITLPASKPEENQDLAQITASIDGTTLYIHRRQEMSGALKEQLQPYLVLDEDLSNSLHRQLNLATTVYDETKEKYHANVREAYRLAREKEKEKYRNELFNYHGSEEGLGTDFTYKLFSIGNHPDSTSLIYQVDYTLDGCVKKAGTNLILSINGLIGDQLELKGEERLRTEDIYLDIPRCYRWNITLQLPQGFQISTESLEKLSMKVENECGAFLTQASTNGSTLTIKAEKRFNQKIEPVANWGKILEITDGAKAYEKLSVVLRN